MGSFVLWVFRTKTSLKLSLSLKLAFPNRFFVVETFQTAWLRFVVPLEAPGHLESFQGLAGPGWATALSSRACRHLEGSVQYLVRGASNEMFALKSTVKPYPRPTQP
jgi:hypothetical protein